MAKRKAAARERPPQKRGPRRLVTVLVCAVLLAAAALTAFVLVFRGERALLTVDGEKVFEEEFRWAMYEARDDVLSRLSAAGVLLEGWDTPTELGTPCDLIAERAVELLKEFYAVGETARDRGYLDDPSFAAVREELDRENRQRRQAVSAGQIFTGLTGYDLDQYIRYRADALRRQYCNDPDSPGMAVTEEELRARYEQDKALYTLEDGELASFEEVRSVVEVSVQEERYDALIEARTGEIEARYDFDELRRYTLQQLG